MKFALIHARQHSSNGSTFADTSIQTYGGNFPFLHDAMVAGAMMHGAMMWYADNN